MSKDMTPMKRYSTLISKMKSIVSPYFNELALNKVDSKYRRFVSYRYWRHNDKEPTYTKGVDSDFILIFQNKGFSTSFALSFNYIDLPQDMQTVVATIKTKDAKTNLDMIIGSKPMSMDVFKQKIMEFNKKYDGVMPGSTSNKETIVKLVDSFATIFIDEKMDINEEIKKSLTLRDQMEDSLRLELGYEGLEEKYKDAQTNLDKTKKTVDKNIAQLSEVREIKKLEELLNNLKVELAQKKSKIERDYNLQEKSDAFKKAQKDLAVADEKIKNALDTFDRSLIKDVRKEVSKSKKP